MTPGEPITWLGTGRLVDGFIQYTSTEGVVAGEGFVLPGQFIVSVSDGRTGALHDDGEGVMWTRGHGQEALAALVASRKLLGHNYVQVYLGGDGTTVVLRDTDRITRIVRAPTASDGS